MLDIEKLKIWIYKNEIDKIVEYAQNLPQCNYNNFIEYLIKELECTQSGDCRNTIAYTIGVLKCNDAIPILVKLIFTPDLKNNRGSLIYALEDLDCGKWLEQLVPLLYEGNYEVRLNVYNLLQNKKREMPPEDIKKSIELLKKKIEEYEDVLDLLCDVHDNILVESES